MVSLLVGAYLSTWSAALIHSLAVPALGSGPESVSTSRQPSKEKPQLSFAPRRHMPLVKSISLVAPPPANAEPSHVLGGAAGITSWNFLSLPPNPLLPNHSNRAPPAC